MLWVEACRFSFFGLCGFLPVVVAEAVVDVVVDVDVVGVVVVVPAWVEAPLQAPTVSPCATCAGTAGAAMLIVCSPPLPVWWQTSILS